MNHKIKNHKYLFLLLQIVVLSLFIVSCNEEEIYPSKDAEYYLQALHHSDATHLDSLYQKALAELSDSTQIDVLFKIYKKSIHKRPIRHDILDTILYKAKELHYRRGIALAYNSKGLNARYALKYKESVDFHKLALEYFRKTSDTLETIKCLNSLGVSLRRLNQEREAMDYYLEALKLSKLIQNDKSIAVALNGIGNVFVNIGQYDKAMPFFREALALETKNNNRKGINYDLSNIGEAFMFQKQYDSALFYYYKALDIAKVLDYKDNASIIYNCIGQLYQLKSDYPKSNIYFQKAIPKLEQYGGKRYLSNSYINMGRNFSYLGEMDVAYENISKGLKLAQEIQSPENIISGYQALSNYYQINKQYRLAFDNYQNAIMLRDSIKGEETKRNIAALEAIYENETKENEIKEYRYQAELQVKHNTILWMFIGFLFVVVIVLILLYRLKRRNNLLVIDQMRNDIQEYIQRIEEIESKPIDSKEPGQINERDIFYKNVEQYGLSEREMDVLLLISKGLKNNEIAEKLFLSVSTIKTHTRNIFIKLDVRNRIEASRKAQNI